METLIQIPPLGRRGMSRLAVFVRILFPEALSLVDNLLCFASERDSPRDQLVVTLFLLTVFGLLLGAGIKGKMLKAGLDTTLPWNAGRKWWEVSFLSIEHIQYVVQSSVILDRRGCLPGSLTGSTLKIGT